MFKFRLLPLPLLLLLPFVGCTPDEGDDDDAAGPGELTWTEEDDDGNGEPWDAEGVDDDWSTTVTILGEMNDCGYDDAAEWSYTGDNDSYNVEVPEDGFIDATLSWDHDSDLDMFIYINGGGQQWEPDVQRTSNGDGDEDWVPDDEFESGDDIVFTIACAQGRGGDYTLVVNWEE